jgi:type IV pilus assembly protein PilE
MRRNSGFTLVELMITVATIGILASIAIPSYRDYGIRSKITEATANLGSLRVNMEQYYQDNRKYNAVANGTCGVPMPVTAIKYFTFNCVSANASGAGDQAYIITAAGNATGGMTGFSYTIDQSNSKTTVIAAPADTAKWGTGDNTCWVLTQKSC